MKKLYEKSEITLAILLIVAYVVLFSAADSISGELGVQKLITAPISLAMAVFLLIWIFRNGLREKYGLVTAKFSGSGYLWFVPLIVISSTNLWRGVALNMSLTESALAVLSMLCVGFIEEVIFRGFLFKAMCRDNVKTAVIVSSLTFGIGHIVNLLNGAELVPTLLQICYAVALGFLFTIIFYRSGSLIPCIISHSAINSLSIFGGDASMAFNIIVSVIMIAVSLLYAVWIVRKTPRKE